MPFRVFFSKRNLVVSQSESIAFWSRQTFAAIAFALTFFGVKVSADVGVVLGLIEIIVFGILAIFLIISAGNGNTLATFNPASSQQPALSGWKGVLFGMLFAFLAFSGFESSAILGEESQNPRRIVPRAILLATICIGVFYMFCSYAGVVGWGFNKITAYPGDPNPWCTMATRVWGPFAFIAILAILNSALGNANAGINAGARMLYAMGRIKAFPGVLGRTNRYHAPGIAIVLVLSVGIIIMLWFGLVYGPTTAFAFTGALLTVPILLVYMATCLSVPREGLVLHLVEYFDKGHYRPLLYRAALSEMYVPYADPTPSHNFKNVFDAGEVGIGVLANSLELGCDCLGEIHYFDATVNDAEGQPIVLANAICMHEEDYGLLWKHLEYKEDGSTQTEVRRSRRLVLSSISTVGNYEYGFYWYLYQDGTIQFEIKLTGIIAPAAIMPGEQPVSGTLVAPGLYGPNHQHYFNVRLDMMVDSLENSVIEVNCEPLPWDKDNPRGNAWVARETLLATESAAQRTIEPRTSRYWKIVNPSSLNALGQPVAYKLMSEKNTFPLFAEGSPQWKRGGFTRSHLWVTAYDPAERYAAGDYPNQQQGGDGLPAYVQKDRPLEKTDLVVWYTFGSNHVVRPEDWPVMPVETVGFHLKPVGFFDGNPALDVPPPLEHCQHP